MKRKSFVLCLLASGCLLFSLTGCNGLSKGAATGPSPKISFEKLKYNLGEVGVNSKRTDYIKFTNTGDAELKIVHVEGCCGVQVTVDKMEFAPGESGTLKMAWKGKPAPAVTSWRVVVHSNDKTNPEATLFMEATTVRRVVVEPGRLKLFLEEENAACPKVTIRSLDDKPFAITGLKSTADCITADFDPNAEATQFVLQPKVNMEKIRDNLQGRLTFELTHPEGSEATVLFDVLPRYTINPQMLVVLRAVPGTPMVRKIKIINNYDKEALQVESVASKGETMAVKMVGQKKTPDGCELELEITPAATGDEDKLVHTETFVLTLKSGEKLSIVCNAYYTTARAIPKRPSGAS
jgi:hypothetical protein